MKLRVLGTHVTLQEELRQRAMTELGIELEFIPMGSAAVLQKAATEPESFDLTSNGLIQSICYGKLRLSSP